MNKFILRIRDGKFQIEHAYSNFDAPEIISVFWPVYAIRPRPDHVGVLEPRDGDMLLTSPGSASCSCDQSAHSIGYDAYLESTRVEGTITKTPYPCPKVRKGIETRYYQGEWQKYTKKDGWVRI